MPDDKQDDTIPFFILSFPLFSLPLLLISQCFPFLSHHTHIAMLSFSPHYIQSHTITNLYTLQQQDSLYAIEKEK